MSAGPDHDLVIVGGGPAGAAAATVLAREGRTPLLLERDRAPRHKICGEFLSVEAQAYLAQLGIDPVALGGAPIRTVRLVSGRHRAEAPLPFAGVGLTRRALDEALLREARASGATVRRGEVARAVEAEGSSLRLSLQGAETIQARTVFLATGKHDLRHPKRPPGPSGGDLIGFKTYFSLPAAQQADLAGAIEIVLFQGGYAGLQCVENGQVNLCLLVRRALFDTVGKTWDALMDHLCRTNEHLHERLAHARALLDRPLSIANVPYGFVHAGVPGDPEGLFRLGDQMGVIPSFSGDGISIALHSAQVAALTYLQHGNAASLYHRRLAREIGGQIRFASSLYDLSRAPLGRLALVTACRLYPGILGTLAAWTRVPAPALRKTGVTLHPARAA